MKKLCLWQFGCFLSLLFVESSVAAPLSYYRQESKIKKSSNTHSFYRSGLKSRVSDKFLNKNYSVESAAVLGEKNPSVQFLKYIGSGILFKKTFSPMINALVDDELYGSTTNFKPSSTLSLKQAQDIKFRRQLQVCHQAAGPDYDKNVKSYLQAELGLVLSDLPELAMDRTWTNVSLTKLASVPAHVELVETLQQMIIRDQIPASVKATKIKGFQVSDGVIRGLELETNILNSKKERLALSLTLPVLISFSSGRDLAFIDAHSCVEVHLKAMIRELTSKIESEEGIFKKFVRNEVNYETAKAELELLKKGLEKIQSRIRKVSRVHELMKRFTSEQVDYWIDALLLLQAQDLPSGKDLENIGKSLEVSSKSSTLTGRNFQTKSETSLINEKRFNFLENASDYFYYKTLLEELGRLKTFVQMRLKREKFLIKVDTLYDKIQKENP